MKKKCDEPPPPDWGCAGMVAWLGGAGTGLVGILILLSDPTNNKITSLVILVGLFIFTVSLFIAKPIEEAITWNEVKRRQLRAEWAGVPDGALSRAQPPGEPTPTAASLSRAEAPEERKSLMVSAAEEAETYETVSVSA